MQKTLDECLPQQTPAMRCWARPLTSLISFLTRKLKIDQEFREKAKGCLSKGERLMSMWAEAGAEVRDVGGVRLNSD